MKQIHKRLTYANVMSTIAVFLVLGGATAFAAHQLGKKTVGTKQLKSNAVTTAKIKKEAVSKKKLKKNAVDSSKVQDGSLTGVDINLSTLGTVPSANSANNLVGFKALSGSGADESVTTLLSTGQFDVVGICDPAGTLTIPGFDSGYNTRNGSAIGIINRGQDNGWADTYDDDDEDFDVGQGVAFDYLDAGDAGSAVLPNGNWVHVLGGAVTEAATNPALGTGCTFHALAFFG